MKLKLKLKRSREEDPELLSSPYNNNNNENKKRSKDSGWRSICASIDMPELQGEASATELLEGGMEWIRSWEKMEAKTRDGRVEMKTAGYLAASMDQRSSALPFACHTACSVLSLTIASWILLSSSHRSCSNSDPTFFEFMPSPQTLDSLLLKGSLFWSRFLSLPQVQARSQPDGLQDMDTVLQFGCPLFHFTRKKKTAIISAALDGSYTAFLRPIFAPASVNTPWNSAVADVAAMAEACSLDAVWPSVIDHRMTDRTFIVGWNAHYFVLHVPAAASSVDGSIFLIDTLGSRFSPSCDKAYLLRFNSHTRLTFATGTAASGTTKTTTYKTAEDACKAYFSRFLTAHTIREASRDFQRGIISQECLFSKLQVDFREIVLF